MSSSFTPSFDSSYLLSHKSQPALARQPSYDLFSSFSSSLSSFARQASFPQLALDDDPFDFTVPSLPSFDDEPPSYDSLSYPLSTRTSTSLSDSSRETTPPLSPHSQAESLSSQSDLSQSSQSEDWSTGQWIESWQRTAPSVTPLPVKEPMALYQPQSTLSNSHPFYFTPSQSSSSSIPLLPLPFTQPLYAFNYHSIDDEPNHSQPSSRSSRRDGLCGGSGQAQPHDGSDPHHSPSSPPSSSPAPLSTSPSSSSSSPLNISPKSLLLSLAAPRSPPAAPTPYLDPNEIVVGYYTRAERAAKIARYREKRANRQFKKKIMYGCRKSFADNRPRVGGRFIKMKDNEEEEQKEKETKETKKGKGK